MLAWTVYLSFLASLLRLLDDFSLLLLLFKFLLLQPVFLISHDFCLSHHVDHGTLIRVHILTNIHIIVIVLLLFVFLPQTLAG